MQEPQRETGQPQVIRPCFKEVPRGGHHSDSTVYIYCMYYSTTISKIPLPVFYFHRECFMYACCLSIMVYPNKTEVGVYGTYQFQYLLVCLTRQWMLFPLDNTLPFRDFVAKGKPSSSLCCRRIPSSDRAS